MFCFPFSSLLVGGIVAEIDFWIPTRIRTIPVKITIGALELLFLTGKNIPKNQLVKFAIRKVIGEVQHDPLFEKTIDGFPENFM